MCHMKGKYNKVLRCGDMVPTEIEEQNYFVIDYALEALLLPWVH
mgnify:CR=1 FL=1